MPELTGPYWTQTPGRPAGVGRRRFPSGSEPVRRRHRWVPSGSVGLLGAVSAIVLQPQQPLWECAGVFGCSERGRRHLAFAECASVCVHVCGHVEEWGMHVVGFHDV